MADARVDENTGAGLAFAVTLDRAARGTVTVDYATANGTAMAGADYTATSGTLSFAAGEASKTVAVAVLDDDHDEGEETLTLRLSHASGARIADASATGTIENTDPLPRGLMTWFGRAAALHVVEHVEERLQAPREPGIRGRFAGRELRRGMARDMAVGFLSRFGGVSGANPAGVRIHGPVGGVPAAGAGSLGAQGLAGGVVGMASAAGPMGGMAGPGDGLMNGRGLLEMGFGGGDVLTRSDFALNRETRGGVFSV